MITAMVSLLWLDSIRQETPFMFVSLQYDLVGETDRKGDRDPKKRAQEIIGKLDVGGDKKLSKQEFIAG